MSRSAVLNLGYLRSSKGYTKFKKKTAEKKPFWVEFLIWGYTKGIQF